MIRLALIIALAACPLAAQQFPSMPVPGNHCADGGDVLLLEDGGASVAVLTYSNSVHQCSKPVDQIMTAPNGIEVRVVVNIGSGSDTRETITITPVDRQYIADPPQASIHDGESVVVIVMAGVS